MANVQPIYALLFMLAGTVLFFIFAKVRLKTTWSHLLLSDTKQNPGSDARRGETGAMTVYMAEREIEKDELEAAQQRMIELSERFSKKGKVIRYIGSTFIPEQSLCMCLFKATNLEVVQDIIEAAGVPALRIVEAVDLPV